jgi:hypothetical protein
MWVKKDEKFAAFIRLIFLAERPVANGIRIAGGNV